jgi:hypothetical protein
LGVVSQLISALRGLLAPIAVLGSVDETFAAFAGRAISDAACAISGQPEELLKLPFALSAACQRAISFAGQSAITHWPAVQTVAGAESAVETIASIESAAQGSAEIAALRSAGVAEAATNVAAAEVSTAAAKSTAAHCTTAAATPAAPATSFGFRHNDDHCQAGHGQRHSD